MYLFGFAIGLTLGSIIQVLFSRVSPNQFLPGIQKSFDALPKVLCWVEIQNYSFPLTRVIRLTWGRRCSKIVFLSQFSSENEMIISHGYEKKRMNDNWNLLRSCWSRIAELYLDKYDWFVKVNFGSFLIPENLVFQLKQKGIHPESPAYFGGLVVDTNEPNQLKEHANGIGYGVSRGLLRILFRSIQRTTVANDTHSKLCPELLTQSDDRKFAECLVEIRPELGRVTSFSDVWGREAFLPYDPIIQLQLNFGQWKSMFWKGKDPKTTGSGIHCCSSRPVLFHLVDKPQIIPWTQYLEYLFQVVLVDPRS